MNSYHFKDTDVTKKKQAQELLIITCQYICCGTALFPWGAAKEAATLGVKKLIIQVSFSFAFACLIISCHNSQLHKSNVVNCNGNNLQFLSSTSCEYGQIINKQQSMA